MLSVVSNRSVCPRDLDQGLETSIQERYHPERHSLVCLREVMDQELPPTAFRVKILPRDNQTRLNDVTQYYSPPGPECGEISHRPLKEVDRAGLHCRANIIVRCESSLRPERTTPSEVLGLLEASLLDHVNPLLGNIAGAVVASCSCGA